MTKRSDFQLPVRASIDADARVIAWDPTDTNGEPFVVSVVTASAAAVTSRTSAQTGSLAGFWTAMSGRNAAPVDILIGPGTSVSSGIGATGQELRWTNRLLTMQRAQYPATRVRGGYGYVPASASGPGTPVNIQTTGTVTPTNLGLGNRALSLGSAATVLYRGATWCSSATLHFIRSSTDSFTVTVDAVLVATVAAGPTGAWTYTTGALTPGFHEILVTQTAGSPVMLGIMLFDGDETVGIRQWDNTKGGSSTADWLESAGGSESWVSYIGSTVIPDLWIIEQMANDGSIASATFTAQLTAIVTAGRVNAQTVPIVFLTPPRRNTPAASGESWDAYVQAVDAVTAATSNSCHLNIDRLMTLAVPGYLFDSYHPSDAGHDLIAQLALEYLVTQSGPSADGRGAGLRGSSNIWNHVAGDVPLTVTGAPSQTAKLVQVNDVANASMFAISPTGDVDVASSIIAVGSITGASVVAGTNAAAGTMRANGPAATVRALQWATAGSNRFILQLTATAESGGNAGSDLQLLARADDGTAVVTVLSIARVNGDITLGTGVDIIGAAGTVLRTGRNVTASRPSASGSGSGAMFYDTTLSRPIWSDGSTWRDAAGSAV